jgi:hypothetical protein
MAEIIARCGFICSRCLIYRDNLKGEQDRRRFRDGLLKYYGDKLTLEECYCDGCLADDSESPIRINKECRIRPCVLKKGLENCAYCEKYPCKILEPAMVDYRKVMERYGAPLPQEDYELFVEPYENRQTLDALRDKRGGVSRR